MQQLKCGSQVLPIIYLQEVEVSIQPAVCAVPGNGEASKACLQSTSLQFTASCWSSLLSLLSFPFCICTVQKSARVA